MYFISIYILWDCLSLVGVNYNLKREQINEIQHHQLVLTLSVWYWGQGTSIDPRNGYYSKASKSRSSHAEVLLGKGALKICSKCTGEHPCRSAVSVTLRCNFIEIILRHGCCPVNLLHIFRTPFFKNTSGWLLLKILPNGKKKISY